MISFISLLFVVGSNFETYQGRFIIINNLLKLLTNIHSWTNRDALQVHSPFLRQTTVYRVAIPRRLGRTLKSPRHC
jgi:hypothetical protein